MRSTDPMKEWLFERWEGVSRGGLETGFWGGGCKTRRRWLEVRWRSCKGEVVRRVSARCWISATSLRSWGWDSIHS